VVVVSEETGSVSIAHNGKLFRYDDENRKSSLLRWIAKTLPRRKRSALLTRLQSYIMKGNGK
jgi:hypothetical protein